MSQQFARSVFVVLVILSIFWLLTGCATVVPSGTQTYWDHTSHPLAGYPFGPSNEEDSLDTFNAGLFWENGNRFTELSLGYKLADGGFYGPKLTANIRTGLRFRFDNMERKQ